MTIPKAEDLEFHANVISDTCIYFELRWSAKARRVAVIKASIQGDTADIGDTIINDLEAAREERLALVRRAGRLLNWRKYLSLKYQQVPEFRGDSLGSYLVERMLEDLRTRGCRRVIGRLRQHDLDTNPKLLGWYQKLGFKAGETRSGFEVSVEL